MPRWDEFADAAPDLAGRVRESFERHGLAFLATVRADGSPRISGIEVAFTDDDMWLGMMPDSHKALDLLRDPRLALHAASADKGVSQGDAKLTGEAIARSGAEYRAAFGSGDDDAETAPPGDFYACVLDLREVSFLSPAGDHLDIDIWSPTKGLRRVERR